ncbi:hypothetical protein LJR289_005762 [Pseudoduganella sp. LjRoot289]
MGSRFQGGSPMRNDKQTAVPVQTETHTAQAVPKMEKGLHARAYNPFSSYWCAGRNPTTERNFCRFFKSTAKDTATSAGAPCPEFSGWAPTANAL